MIDKSIFAKLREHMDVAPVDVETAAKALGIEVVYAFLASDISGQIELISDGHYRITVNASDTLTRQRFTLAHELGHFIYHRPLIGNGVDDDRAYRSTESGRYHNLSIGPKQETDANRFAANLLMPISLIKQLRKDGVVATVDLASVLGVSVPAMRVRQGKPPYPDQEQSEIVAKDDEGDGGLPELGEPTF